MARFAPTFNPSGVFMRPEQQRRLTRFVASLVKDDRGAIARIAALTGYDRTTVSHWFAAEPEGRSYCMPYDVLPHVIDVLGSIEPLRAAAEEVGYDVVPKARPTSCARPVQEGVWELLARTATVGREVAEAARDGKIDAEEARRLRAALHNVRDITDEMVARLPLGGH